MFIGHLALAFVAKKPLPKANLGLLLLAASWLDVVWPFMLLAGWERVRIVPGATAYTPLVFESYPWTHSLAMVFFWALLLGGLALAATRDRRVAAGTGLLVLSHWILDWFSHAPDLPLWPGGPGHGLGLWNSVPATVVVETALFATGVGLYLRATRARGTLGHVALWSLLLVLAFAYTGNSLGLALPPSERALALGALVNGLPPLWGLWIEATRGPA